MATSRIQSLKIRAKLLQKAKMKSGQDFRLKDALNSIARGAGFETWRDLKQTLEQHEALNPHGAASQWNVWYSDYAEARAHLEKNGGFLLPYQKHFFICEADYVQSLGVQLDHPDLDKVGNNWVEPKDFEAWKRLLRALQAKGRQSE